MTIGLALLLAVSAQAAPDPDCQDDRGVDRCEAAQQARVRAMFGVEPIESHRAAGDQVRRVFYVDGYGRDVVAIAFVRRPGHDPEVRVHFRREAGAPDLQPLVAPVPADVWDRLIERSSLFDRRLVPLTQPADSQEMIVCLHSWVYTVEATDPVHPGAESPTLRRRTEDACSNGITEAFAHEVYEAALPLFPHCALLQAGQYRNPANQLAACGILSGDRVTAARARNQANELFYVDRMEDLPRLTSLFDFETQIDWNGERYTGREAEGAARFFLSKLLEAERNSFFVERIEGLDGRRARLRGGVARFVSVPDQEDEVVESAPVEMIWEQEYRDRFLIRSVTVGPYARVPQR